MRVSTPVALLTLTLSGSCTANNTVDLDAERTALADAADAYYDAAIAKDRDSVVAFYADDALMIPPNADRVGGIEEVGNYRFGFIESPGVELEFVVDRLEVAASGDIGWTLATGDVSFTDADGQPGRDRVRDFHTWRKVNGRWMVVIDMWNSNPPADGPESP